MLNLVKNIAAWLLMANEMGSGGIFHKEKKFVQMISSDSKFSIDIYIRRKSDDGKIDKSISVH